MKKIALMILIIFMTYSAVNSIFAQSSWTRSEEKAVVDLQLFRANQTINLPTAETLEKATMEFEISHRFLPAFSDGIDYFYGIDGPVRMRLGLNYGVTNRLTLTLARSNIDGNIDYKMRYRIAQIPNDFLPLLITAQGGVAWNTFVFVDGQRRKTGDSRNFQFYGQLILNTMIHKKFGIGLVPSFVNNSDIYDPKTRNTINLGGYLEYYPNRMLGVMVEFSPVVNGFKKQYNSASFGLEINTGGHFFKLIATNSIYLNPAQYLSGADYQFKPKSWHFGFNITRLLQWHK